MILISTSSSIELCQSTCKLVQSGQFQYCFVDNFQYSNSKLIMQSLINEIWTSPFKIHQIKARYHHIATTNAEILDHFRF